MTQEVENFQEKDFSYNWVNSSRFLFYLQVLCIVAFIIGGCFELYQHRYKGKPEVTVQGSSLYVPDYK